eukprot:1727414-Amphidinium_carterae.1
MPLNGGVSKTCQALHTLPTCVKALTADAAAKQRAQYESDLQQAWASVEEHSKNCDSLIRVQAKCAPHMGLDTTSFVSFCFPESHTVTDSLDDRRACSEQHGKNNKQ